MLLLRLVVVVDTVGVDGDDVVVISVAVLGVVVVCCSGPR